MKQEHDNVDGEALSEANQCIALGVGVGGLGAGAALVLGATCPLCVIAAPGLIGWGLIKRRSARRSSPGKDETVPEKVLIEDRKTSLGLR